VWVEVGPALRFHDARFEYDLRQGSFGLPLFHAAAALRGSVCWKDRARRAIPGTACHDRCHSQRDGNATAALSGRRPAPH
jgi:hypothetical protein